MTIDELLKNENLKNQLEKLSSDEVSLMLDDTAIRNFRKGAPKKKTAVCIRIREDILDSINRLFNNEDKFASAGFKASLSGGVETILELFLSRITDKEGKLIETSDLFQAYKRIYDNNKPSPDGYAGRAGKHRKVE